MSIQKHVPALDGLRGIAVLWVMIYHLGGGAQSQYWLVRLIGATFKRGFAGVPLFFVLSGFLITGILWDSKGSDHWWRNFFARRTLRIFPLYYASLILTATISLWQGFDWHAVEGLWVYVLYLQNVSAVMGTPTHLALSLGHYWSLAVEEQFYLIWPLILYKLRSIRQAQAICLSVLALSAIFNGMLGLKLLPWNHSAFVFNVGGLVAGAYLSLARRSSQWNALLKWSKPACVVGLGMYFLLTYVNLEWDRNFAQPFLWIGFCGLLLNCFQPGAVKSFMGQAWLRKVGSLSYGLYVYHVLLLPLFAWLAFHLAPAVSRNTHLALVFVIGIALSFAAAYVSYTFFEKPFLRLKKFYPEGTINRQAPVAWLDRA